MSDNLDQLAKMVDEAMEESQRTYTTGTGQELTNIHSPTLCSGRACVIHSPSKHPLSDAPTHWREDRQIMERICEHGVGHPDPDDLHYQELKFGRDYGEAAAMHGCDGCCGPREVEAEYLEDS